MNFKDVENGAIPPYLMRFFKKTGKTINRYSMIKENDKVLLGISGGKDSLLLSLALSIRKKWLPISYDLQAVMINWIEHPITDENRALLFEYFDTLKIPFTIVDENMFSQGFNGEFNCYLCSRNRRRILFSIAEERGIDKIALGHHYDDVIETILMGMLYGAQVQTMMPKLHSTNFEGLELIRPLYLIREEDIIKWMHYNELHFIQCACRFTESCASCGGTEKGSKRAEIKELIRELKQRSPHIEKNIFRSVENVNLSTVIAYKEKGVKHHFLDSYDETAGTEED